MAYMAPEVLNRKGYSWAIDWWSLGLTTYELLFQRRPFDGRTAEKMTHSILNDPFIFPEDAESRCSPDGLHVLRSVSLNIETLTNTAPTVHFSQLLDRNTTTRLGCRPNGQGMTDIRRHPWFKSIDWDSLEAKEIQPPFVPDVSCRDIYLPSPELTSLMPR
jgi:serine/threonine kinase 32